MKTSSSTFAIAILAAFFLIGFSGTSLAATAVHVSGDVYYLGDDGEKIPVSAGDVLPGGKTIFTGEDGKIAVSNINGNTRTFGSNTSFLVPNTRVIRARQGVNPTQNTDDTSGVNNETMSTETPPARRRSRVISESSP